MAINSTDAISLPLDADGDFDVDAFQAGGLSVGTRAVAEGIRCRLLLIRGEWFLDEAAGVPYFERPGVPARDALLAGRYDEAKVLTAMREAILDTPGVESVTKLTAAFNGNTRVVAVAWSVRCTFGDVVSDTLDLGAP